MPRQSFFFDSKKTREELQVLQQLLDRKTSAAKRQAVCDALQRIACPYSCFVIEEQAYCLVTMTTRPFLLGMGTSHSCEQAEANSAGYHRLNALAQARQNAVRMLNQPQSEER